MSNNSELLTVAIEAALLAGALLRQGFGTSFEISFKEGDHNLVTTYDRLAEKAISETISRRFPTHGFLGEEAGHNKSGTIIWIVDPLDGTVNFAHNIPAFSVSIAAVIDNKVVVGVIYQPITQELFWAEAGKGAYLNGKPLKVSSQKNLNKAYLATGFPYNVSENPLNCIETFDKLTRKGIPIRRFGSAAIDLSYVAAGRFDGYWEVTLQPWDVAAGLLIVEEAGGRITRYDGSPCNPFEQGTVLASNKHLHSQLLEAL
ncbi:MAG: inositol monophosphatase [Rhabdochlamydiaceae bacterium]|nr:inositol monophosphatase [Rhabdochlamydiaceae bacterium]